MNVLERAVGDSHVYCHIRYHLYPTNDINFGPMLISSKKIRSFVIENRGERFDFKYTISRMLSAESQKQEDKKTPK